MPQAWPTIDVHVHLFPQPEAIARLERRFKGVRDRARSWLRPFTGTLHTAQTWTRHIPSPIRLRLDELAGLVPLPTLLVESTPGDLLGEMDRVGVARAFLAAHPPAVDNEFVFEICAAHSERLLPVAYIPSGTARPGKALDELVSRGARALKIHPAADGEGPESPRYRALLKTAADRGLPVLLHTGGMSSHLVYRAPELSGAERYAPWFEKYPETPFILAQMNFHSPAVALDLGEEFEQVRVDTAWQPPEIIGEAVRRLGAEKVLFGSGWPFIGNNLEVGIARIRDCEESGMITHEQSRLILGENAAKLWGLGTT